MERLRLTEEDIAAALPTVSAGLVKVTLDDLTAVPPQPTASPDLDVLESLMFNLVNAARLENLLRWLPNNQLKWHPGLAAVARGHSADMLKRQYVDHTSPDGVTSAQRLTRYGIQYLACGENIGIVYGAASHSDAGIYEIQNKFMNQPRKFSNHRGNLLNPLWTHVGIGLAYTASGALVATQNFISTI
ncbi:MAG: CAP domain-containing protein [Chloroflexi bacterium]|nr:CAP domain-containing protein [Chloroflexota bacterium]MBK6712792.1 CAP domain-containing protein [Chloroflexota bacterium]MBK8934955.1 CAP domain-containing protein [Chloroflexota bacterium]